MKTPLIAFVLFAAVPFASAQETREPAPIDVAPQVQPLTVRMLADETGLSPQHVRVVLGARSLHPHYRSKEQQFRQALGEDRYQDLLAGQPIKLRNQPVQGQGLAVATEASRDRKERP
ncbi:hypothetical protein [Pseudoxanthomonas suwonensis]|uniref:Uncharacterized protein n=1 Tax=Pseudoxanthomonas suwonensis TaxID=314722 RepID=A0A0E3UMM3_9GAMM|nr:hypothetical protein [Pseudoxanthomonas suwonensis]AKC86165.1 hypothetical protein WQ53_04615 [Pseudoxanthomonas suwonensis]